MSKQGLTGDEKRMLERLHDAQGGASERAQAERLIAQSSLARGYMSALKEVRLGVLGAEQAMWEGGGERLEVEQVVGRAWCDDPMAGRSLEELSPLLERFHDGEASAEEIEEVEQLRACREDVAAYLEGLSELELGVLGAQEEALSGVDFARFWGELEGRIEEERRPHVAASSERAEGRVVSFPGVTRERPMFNNEDHQVLLYRYHDGEVSEQEVAQVKAWQEIDPGVALTLGALEELHLATTVAMEQAVDRLDGGLLWERLEAGLDALDAEQEAGPKVASLSEARERKEAASAARSNHRREVMIALAAVVFTVFGVGLFKEQLFGPSEVVVEKTVVIVDSLEYGDGTSVMVTGPMQSASMVVEPKKAQADEAATVGEEDEEEGATPTVIWLIDPMEEGEGGGAAGPSEEEVPVPAVNIPAEMGQPI